MSGADHVGFITIIITMKSAEGQQELKCDVLENDRCQGRGLRLARASEMAGSPVQISIYVSLRLQSGVRILADY